MKLSEFCKIVGTSEELIRSKSRKQSLVNLRQIYCFICREKYHMKVEDIAKVINRTHGLVSHSYNVISGYISIKDTYTLEVLEKLNYKKWN